MVHLHAVYIITLIVLLNVTSLYIRKREQTNTAFMLSLILLANVGILLAALFRVLY